MKFLKSALGLSLVLASGSLIGCMTADEGGTSASPTEEAAYLRSQGNGSANGSVNANPSDVEKVSICHVPPGNPAAAHTIVVGSPAVKAHLAHGDYLGECGDNPPEVDPPVVDPPVETDPPADPDDGTGEET